MPAVRRSVGTALVMDSAQLVQTWLTSQLDKQYRTVGQHWPQATHKVKANEQMYALVWMSFVGCTLQMY